MKRKRVLVTGAAGFIGSHLCERLLERGYKVSAFIRYNSINSWGYLEELRSRNKIRVFAGDIRNYDSVKYALKDIDAVFHLAALISIPYSYYSPDSYVDTNVKGTLNVLQAAMDLNLERVIQVSTSEVYGTAQFVPITEKHPVSPQSPYAASKLSADFIGLSFYRSFGLPVSIVRPFNTFGPRQSARAIIPAIIIQMLSGCKKIKLGSLNPTRDFTYVSDTVDAFINAYNSNKSIGKIINVGSNFEISIGDIANLIAKNIGVKNIKFICDYKRMRPKKSEVERLLADNTKAMEILSWKPKYSLGEGLNKTIDWFKKNKNKYKSQIYNI